MKWINKALALEDKKPLAESKVDMHKVEETKQETDRLCRELRNLERTMRQSRQGWWGDD